MRHLNKADVIKAGVNVNLSEILSRFKEGIEEKNIFLDS